MTRSDLTLIEELKQGKEAAFRELVDTYQRKVYNTCLGFVKNPAEADDLAQEVFIEIFRSILHFRMESKLSTWIYRIAVSKSLQYLRSMKRKKRLAFFVSFFSDGTHEAVVDYIHPGVIAENKERSRLLFEAIEKLPETQRTAYTLHKLEDLSYEEIADIMQKSVSSIESIMHRAKMNLQADLYNYYNADRKFSKVAVSNK
ncbi:MAG: RNA polymerase sigma factor [Cyclobacteriaceae bacterium]|nr:RNA polymerase sigma factor [Cyclobacteriaceae bacterium]